MSGPAVGIIANPMSGRDVRRFAARAAMSTLESKRNQVARVVVGAAAAGAERVVVMKEPLRASVAAVENLSLQIDVEVLEWETKLTAEDTKEAARRMRDSGCGALVVLGGDGTNRAVAEAWPGAPIVPISTGTNNVFPRMVEATTAGVAAGLVATGRLSVDEVAPRDKVVRARFRDEEEIALIDAVLLVDDSTGNLMPFEADKIRMAVLSRAEPDAVGISPIGGLLEPCGVEDDFGVVARCTDHTGTGQPLLVPISPGLFRNVHVEGVERVELGSEIVIPGPGIVAFDGDRLWEVPEGEEVRAVVDRSGPRSISVPTALRCAARDKLFVDRPGLRDTMGGVPGCC